MGAILLIPFALTYAYGRMVKDQKQGWVVFGAMFLLWAGSVAVATGFEVGGNQSVDHLGVNVTQEVTDQQAGGNMEGKEVRFGPGRLRRCSPPPPRARRPAPSSPPTTASPRSAGPLRSST